VGADGPGLFSDDTACDVRSSYRELVGDGLSGPEATDHLTREWAGLLDDPDEGPVFWLALASTQWKAGRLEPRVLAKALDVIDGGSDLLRWQHDQKLLAKRTKVLGELREQLESPQPAQKRIPKRFRDSSEWEVGEVISYRLPSGTLSLMRVIGYHGGVGGSPMFELLDWAGTKPPGKLRLRLLRVRTGARGDSRFVVARTRQNQLPVARIERLGVTLKPSQAATTPFFLVLWDNLDRNLESVFGLR
jgi:hypothetical protein